MMRKCEYDPEGVKPSERQRGRHNRSTASITVLVGSVYDDISEKKPKRFTEFYHNNDPFTNQQL